MAMLKRQPSEVMCLDRLGSLHASRLSFLRILLRRIEAESWHFERTSFVLDPNFVGHAVYTAFTPNNAYSLVVFAHQLDPENRSDRVIANAWDATFTLFDGVPLTSDVERLRVNVPCQETGRLEATELTLSRANKSVRLWDAVVECLSKGLQPSVDEIDAAGYLMRTTAVYGSGKFGACDREMIADRREFAEPFQAEMLTVLLIRQFARDWVEYEASCKCPGTAVGLDEALAQRLGIGNSTGLGMAPFLMNHPVLIDHWMNAREEAIARVQGLSNVSAGEVSLVRKLISRARSDFQTWTSQDLKQANRISHLIEDLDQSINWLEFRESSKYVWRNLLGYAKDSLGFEAQEFLASVILEPYSYLVDELGTTMSVGESEVPPVNGAITVADTLEQIQRHYDWLDDIAWQQNEATALVWYVSEEKLEPRLGRRNEDASEAHEQPLAPARDMQFYRDALVQVDPLQSVAEFLLKEPLHRLSATRLQWIDRYPYGEIRGNTISSRLKPIDLLRCKLSFFGATRFDPRSDRWLRISLFRNAPYLEHLGNADEYWIYGPEQ